MSYQTSIWFKKSGLSNLQGNNFYGNILGRGGGLLMPYLQVFNAANNSFSGSIPYLIRGSSMLYWLDLSNNQLDGKIPGSIGDLLFLRYLWLRSNLLTVRSLYGLSATVSHVLWGKAGDHGLPRP
eukprot:77274-Chlamydomonas_euryale.AAC.5